MNKNMILSIVVPVYNVEKYLDICLENIINNCPEGVEIILVDDGSNDNSALICDKYGDRYENIKVKHKENGGLSSARNVGIEQSSGKYIWFIDSDDYINPDSIDIILKMAQKNFDLIIGSYCEVFQDGSVIDDCLKEPRDEKILPYKYFQNLGSTSYAAVRFIVKRDLIIQNNIYFTPGIYHEDEDWTPRVLINSTTYGVINQSIYNYRVGNPKSIMGMCNPKKVYDKIYISKKIYNNIKEEKLDNEIVDFLRSRIEHNFIAALNEVVLYSGSERDHIISEINESIYVLNDIKTRKVKLVKIAIKSIGIKNTSKLLTLRNYIKKLY